MNLKQIKTAMLPAVLMLVMLLCGGCGDPANYDLPAQPQEFKVVDFTNPDLNTDAYASVEYNGRSYIPFGTLNRKLKGADVGDCLGYITQMDMKDEATRITLLKADSDCNFLIAVDTDSESLQTTVMRAIDTKKKDIPIPDFIKDEGYEFWK